ncbi:Hsp70 family protein [Desulfotomaculum copahuensis]|uniref:Chaperone protein DnaK n=1 Tax=Desulfotomaculum copahuensis TaxID=1838280 RepID=A0A1B7LFG3_9FIRM|nr:Hsp70 family protein [Desulfotomaculum copahuensis]OAT82354.1 heat-shock protein Hsp70 [Desulfotomaculum copahuensis]
MNKKNNVENNLRPVVGIDLGTTNSAIACMHHGKPEIIPSPRGERIIPSVVMINPQGNIIVGEDARAALIAMPNRTVAAVKRKMGSNERIPIGDRELLPQEISALILKELKSYADNWFGEGEKEAVITVPAYFTDEQRRATKQAGELAGFIVERIINEPTAAAMAFGLAHLKEDRYILVYDLGGGTFDVSVLEMMSGILEVKASTGNNHLGGEDFDWLIVDWLAEQIMAEHGIDPRDDIRARALLKEEAEKIKIRLSQEESLQIFLPLVTVKDNQPVGISIIFTREQFIALIDDLLLQTMDLVGQALKDAGLKANEIDEIILVGGSTRIPRVRALIRDYFGKEPRSDVHPDEAVALGAAVQAGIKSGLLAESGLIVTDVAPFSLGIAVLKEWKGISVRPGGFHVLIPRNTTIPVTRRETFYTASPGQTAASIEVYQGENEWVKNNHPLGEFLLEGIPPNRAGAEDIEVTFHYNLNGILEITARCVSNNKEINVTIQDDLNRSSAESFELSKARIESLFNAAGGDVPDDGMEDEWDLDDTPEPEEELPAEVLHEEASRLRERALGLLEECGDESRPEIQKLIALLDEAMTKNDLDGLQETIDRVTDLLIEIEFQEDV